MDRETYLACYQYSISHPELFWAEQASRYLQWDKPWEHVLTGSLTEHNIRWFSGGELNASINCLDRHLPTHKDKPAIIWEGDLPSQNKVFTYQQLHDEVCRFAQVLKQLGIEKGARVCIYLPMIPEIIITVLSCARIGAIHSVVFAGFSAHALRQRIKDSGCRLVITADEGMRGGKLIPLKENTDLALTECPLVKHVIVVKQSDRNIAWQPTKDRWYHELMTSVPSHFEAVSMEANDPLFILYTSGSTGIPKGVMHATGGYLLHAAMSFNNVFNYESNDIFWCTADVGWITGHSYVVYGPLLNAATIVIYAGVPNFPSAGRYWQIIDKHQVTIFYTAPTAIRALMREGSKLVEETSRKSLKLLGSVGEPINPEAWRWYYEVVGNKRCPIVDTWWQTETGGIMLTPLPNATPLKPGSVAWPFFGVEPALVDSENNILTGESEGNLVITAPWPGMLQTIFNDEPRFISAYLEQSPGYYFTGDQARRDSEGYYWILGRIDDVINVSGHRLATAEIESALVLHPKVAEAAVVGYEHEIKGQGIYAFVTLLAEEKGSQALINELRQWVRQEIGAIATPDKIRWATELPKTRSGKIMRRLLRKIANHDLNDLGDLSTLGNPEIIKHLIAP